MWIFLVVSIFQQLLESPFIGSLLCLKWLQIIFNFWGGISIDIHNFWGAICTPCPGIIFPRKGTPVHLKQHLSLFNMRFYPFHIWVTHLNVLSWFWPSSLYPTIKIMSAMLNIVEILSIFHWKMSPLVLHWVAIWHILLYHIDKQVSLDMMTFCPT